VYELPELKIKKINNNGFMLQLGVGILTIHKAMKRRETKVNSYKNNL
jgi:hypothetical protein